MPTLEDLRYFQSLPLDIKVAMTQTRLREWVNHYGVNNVYVSFSGGKDSTVLLHIAREMYSDIPACFVDTGLEYPEIKASTSNNITAQMAEESQLRMQKWLQNGCNAFDCKRPISNPMSFWTEQDVLMYIKENNLPIASVYGDIVYEDLDGQTRLEGCGKLCTTGCDRTGCVFCGFGAHLEKGEGRFERLKRTHPKLYEYCMGGGAYGEDGIWRPDNKGLGMAHVIDELCKLYGKDFIKY